MTNNRITLNQFEKDENVIDKSISLSNINLLTVNIILTLIFSLINLNDFKKTVFKKKRKKIKSFLRDQFCGDIINQLLLLAVALVIIGLLLAFAINQFLLVKDGFVDLFTP